MRMDGVIDILRNNKYFDYTTVKLSDLSVHIALSNSKKMILLCYLDKQLIRPKI